MATTIHFCPKARGIYRTQWDKTACGASVSESANGTGQREEVTCGRCKKSRAFNDEAKSLQKRGG